MQLRHSSRAHKPSSAVASISDDYRHAAPDAQDILMITSSSLKEIPSQNRPGRRSWTRTPTETGWQSQREGPFQLPDFVFFPVSIFLSTPSRVSFSSVGGLETNSSSNSNRQPGNLSSNVASGQLARFFWFSLHTLDSFYRVLLAFSWGFVGPGWASSQSKRRHFLKLQPAEKRRVMRKENRSRVHKY